MAEGVVGLDEPFGGVEGGVWDVVAFFFDDVDEGCSVVADDEVEVGYFVEGDEGSLAGAVGEFGEGVVVFGGFEFEADVVADSGFVVGVALGDAEVEGEVFAGEFFDVPVLA